MSRRPALAVADGMTLVEVLVAMSLAGVLAAMAITGYRGWAVASAHKGTANAVQTVLRNAQVRAVSEGVSFCVLFNQAQSTYTVNRFACNDSPQKVEGPYATDNAKVRFTGASFTSPDGTTMTGVTFRPTGAAWPGSVRVVRDGSAKEYLVTVEGFTGRVSIS